MAMLPQRDYTPSEWKQRFPLLGPKDFLHLDRLGLPSNPAGLYSFTDEGMAVCTARGAQFLAALFAHHGLDEVVAGQTRQSLARVAQVLAPELLARNRVRLQADLASGSLGAAEQKWARSHLRV